MIEKTRKIWMDGEFVHWDQANVHILTHSLHYGLGAFEGIRSYRRPGGSSVIFRLQDHIRRLFDSCHIARIKIPFSQDDLCHVCQELLIVNELDEAYIRPLVFIGEGAMGLKALENPVRVAIISWRWGSYLGEDALTKGIKASFSSTWRHSVASSMSKAKICGYYANATMAKRDAVASGFDEAIMLDHQGYVAEGTGENLFIVKNGLLQTPPYSSSILGGITRDSVIRMARDMGLRVKPQLLTRDEIFIADEVFFTGTAAEITPVVDVDNRLIGGGTPGPVTMALQKKYFGILRGQEDGYDRWLWEYSIKSR